jgi:short-chain fatty acids transporter
MRTIARVFTRIAERTLPDAFIFLVLLTLLVLVLGMGTGANPREVLNHWGEGFFSILEFTMQSTLMLVLGFALANTPPVHAALRRFAKVPRNEVQVIVVTVLVMMAASWISWGFGLIAGGIVAREMGIVHRGKVHYPLVVASAYAGFLVWHAGYGGSIPQLVATPGHFLEEQMGVVPVSETIFSTTTLIILAALVVVVPLAMVLMRPSAEERVSLPDSVLPEGDVSTDEVGAKSTPSFGPGAAHAQELERKRPFLAERLEHMRAVPLILGFLGLLYLVSYYAGGGSLNINMVIYSFLVAGLLLIPSVREYLNQLAGGARAAAAIIVQFPFYGALMGVMVGTGMVTTLANFFADISSADTLPFWSFISGGIVNMFVPSGGGQWAVQGPIMTEAAAQLGADQGSTAMGLAWGDAWTNMIQPFWALPLLAIAGLGIRDIMGYTAVLLFLSGAVIGGGLLLF